MGAGRTVVVSGGGTGIGRAVAEWMADAGDDVVIIGRRAEQLKRTAAEVADRCGADRVRPVVADLSEPDDVRRATAEITAAGDEIDVLVNNAGGNAVAKPSGDLDGIRRDWLANVTANVLPTVLLTHALLPSIRRGSGRIVAISSVAALRGPASYGGSKAALQPWATELSAKLAPEGVTVNLVAPGYTEGTEFYGDRMSEEFHAGRARQSPMNRGGTVREMAAAVAYLAGPDAGFLTGQVIHINGGAYPAMPTTTNRPKGTN